MRPLQSGPRAQERRSGVTISRRIAAAELGPGPWGMAASQTVVGQTRTMDHERARRILTGRLELQVEEAVRGLHLRGAADASGCWHQGGVSPSGPGTKR